MTKQTNKVMIYNVARMYYVDNFTQDDISVRMGISRPQVSRMIKKARDLGIVEITIHAPIVDDKDDIEKKVAEKLGLKRVEIVESNLSGDDKRNHALEPIAAYAGEILPELIGNSKYVGIGWGMTVYKTVLALDFNHKKIDTCFVPIIGSLGMMHPHYQVNSIVDRISEKFKSRKMFINLPAYMQDVNAKELALKSEQFCELSKIWDELDMAVIGLGVNIQNSDFLKSQLDDNIVATLKDNEIVGDVLGQFFCENGHICKTDLDSELTALSVDKLSKIKNVVCLCGGSNKVKGIIIASRMKYFNILITDHITALEILKECEEDEL